MGAEWAREAGAGALRVSKQEPALLTLGSWESLPETTDAPSPCEGDRRPSPTPCDTTSVHGLRRWACLGTQLLRRPTGNLSQSSAASYMKLGE